MEIAFSKVGIVSPLLIIELTILILLSLTVFIQATVLIHSTIYFKLFVQTNYIIIIFFDFATSHTMLEHIVCADFPVRKHIIIVAWTTTSGVSARRTRF